MTKPPAFQFYPGDWLRDTALRSCSVGARGLWIDMICLMHEGYPYGHLKVNHKVILPPNLARMVGATLEDVEGWLHELDEAGVYSIDDDGCIYSRRMVRDAEIRAKRAAGGSLGGNPHLKGEQKDNCKVRDKVNLPSNLPPTPASSSAFASASALNTPKPQRGSCVYSEEFEEFWKAYPNVRKVSKAAAWRSWLKEIRTTDPSVIIAAAREFATSPKGKGEYSPKPVTWLNGRCWQDDRAAWGMSSSGSPRLLTLEDA